MEPPVDTLSRTLASNLRAARAARHWRQQDLADRAGISKSLLQQIEAGRVNPSIATVAHLSDSLGVAIAQLVEQPADLGEVTRSAEIPARRCGRAGRSSAWLMINDGRAPFLELWRFVVAPGDEVESDGHPAGTRELITVTAGSLLVVVGGAEFHLATDDALAIRGDRTHSYRNAGSEPVRFTMSVVYSGEQDPRFAAARTTKRR